MACGSAVKNKLFKNMINFWCCQHPDWFSVNTVEYVLLFHLTSLFKTEILLIYSRLYTIKTSGLAILSYFSELQFRSTSNAGEMSLGFVLQTVHNSFVNICYRISNELFFAVDPSIAQRRSPTFLPATWAYPCIKLGKLIQHTLATHTNCAVFSFLINISLCFFKFSFGSCLITHKAKLKLTFPLNSTKRATLPGQMVMCIAVCNPFPCQRAFWTFQKQSKHVLK